MKPLILALAVGGLLATGTPTMAQAIQGSPPKENTPTVSPDSSSATSGDRAAASGDTNQAVATTSANATAPAKGANSFTMGEARSRIESSGFSNVGDLRKDDDGVWHGNAQKSGTGTMVWLDYKGNVGESKKGDK